MRETIERVTDDLTGREDESAKQVKVSFDGKSYTVDLSDASREALMAFLSHNGTENLIRLLAPAPAPAASRRAAAGTRQRTAAPSGTGQIKLPDGRFVPREEYMTWATSKGHRVNSGRGAQPKDTLNAYVAAHPAGSRPAVSAPAPGSVPPAPGQPDGKSAGQAAGKPAA